MPSDDLRPRPRPQRIAGHSLDRYEAHRKGAGSKGRASGGAPSRHWGYRCSCRAVDYGVIPEKEAAKAMREHWDAVWAAMEAKRIAEAKAKRDRDRRDRARWR